MIFKTLKKATLTALLWSFIERFSLQLSQFFFTIFLARVLSPSDFGLLAMIAIFITLSNSFIDSGFGHALIQKQNSDKLDESSIFYFNIVLSSSFSCLLFLSAPLISKFYNVEELINIIRILSLSLILNSLGLVQRTLLIKSLNFKTLFKVQIIATTSSGVIAIILALNNFGVYSLVFMTISHDFINTLLLWIYSSWRPYLKFSFNSLKSMFSFGSKLFIVSLSNSFFTNIYNIIIGKLYTSEILGFYSKGYSFSRIPVNLILNTANQVFFPVFSKLQNDKVELKNTLQIVSKNLMMVTFPAMIGFIMISEELVIILLTEKWIQIVPYLQLLSISAIFHPLIGTNITAINSLGRSDLYLKVDIFNKILIIIIIYFTYKYGIFGLIYGHILSVIISHFLYSYFINILLNYSVFQQIEDLSSMFLVSTTMGICVYSIEYLNISNLYINIVVKLMIGLFTYTFLLNLLRIKEFLDFKNMIISKFNF